MAIKRFLPIFAYIYKGFEMDFYHVFYHQENPRKKYGKKVCDPKNGLDLFWASD